VADTPFGCVGILICADNFPDSLHLARSLAHMGCKLLLSPCAWAVDADHDNQRDPYGGLWTRAYGELSRCCGMTVVGVSNVGWLTAGPWAGRKCIGSSLAMGPEGVLAQLPYGHDAEALVVVEV
jgi:predicted amidohydrolase